MKKIRLTAVLMAAMLLLSVSSAAFAEGFGVYEWSAAGTAMGENYMFAEDDPAVLAYNPSAITKLDGSYISFGTSWVNPATSISFTNGPLNAGRSSEYDNEYSPAFTPYFYYAKKVSSNGWFGLAAFPRFGNNIEYDDAWAGRYDTIFSGVKGITIQPTYAFKIGSKLSAAVGLDINYVNLKMRKDTPAMAGALGYLGDLQSLVEGHSTNLGWVASLTYDFNEKTSAAITYRARVKQTMDADASFYGSLAMLGDYRLDTRAHGTVTLPDSVAIGLGHKFNDRTRMEINAIWTNWSTFNALNLTFDDRVLGVIDSSNSVKDWKAAWRIGIGLEHKLSDKWSLLCGYVFDQSPVPDERMDFMVPTGDRHRGSIGFKYRPTENSEIAFAYTAIWAGNRYVASQLNGMDFTNAYIHDGLTQIVSLGYTMKLK
ncbi:MAG: outer membrane protein transport protein [Synergistes sp.]|nr:outer membrane protein transport protein [Synergistes sp.]